MFKFLFIFLSISAQATSYVDNIVIENACTLSALTANTVAILNGSKVLSSSSISTTTLGYLDATSSIQTQLNNKVSSQWVATGSDIYYSAGNVMIGQAVAPSSKLHVVETSTSATRGLLVDQVSGANTSGARITIRKARGSPGSLATIVTGDVLGSWTASGHDGTNYVDSAKVIATSTGTIGTGIVPSTLQFQTMNSSGTLTTGLTISSAQAATFANTVNATTFVGALTGIASGNEVPLTFSTGLTRTTNTITSNLSTGVSGGQTAIGGTGASDALTLSSTSNGTKGKINLGSSSAYDETNVRLGLNLTDPVAVLETSDSSNTLPRGITGGQYSTDVVASALVLKKARGTRSSPTTLVTGDGIGNIIYQGYDGSNYLSMASIQAASTGTIATTRVPTKLVFNTATNATPSVLTAALTLNSDQSATFANTVNATTFVGALTGTASGNEVPLTFGNGVTRTTNAIANDLTTGVSGGQTLTGGTGSGDNLTIRSTSNATQGSVLLNSKILIGSSLGTVTHILGPNDQRLSIQGRTPVQTASALAGNNFIMGAGNAVAGSSNAGAAAGGSMTYTSGNAARLTSGNADGGSHTFTTGTGIGTGVSGSFLINIGGANTKFSVLSDGHSLFQNAPVATANYGTVSIGSGAFDGSTSGFFVGSSSGTSIAINEVSGYAGNIFDSQVAGVVKARITNAGVLSTAGAMLVNGAAAATNDALVIKDGHIKSSFTTALTAAVNANAGTGATCSISAGDDNHFSLSLTTTAVAPAAGVQCTVTFNKAFNSTPICTFMPTNGNASLFAVANGEYFTKTTTTLVVNYSNADATGHANTWDFQCVE